MPDYFLSLGSHNTREEGMCALEWVAFVAGEPHSDRPVCVSPLLQSFAVSLNDNWDDEQRQKLRPYLARCIGTANDGRDMERSWLATDWLIRVFTPRFLDLVPSLALHTVKLRALSPVMAPAALDEAMIVLREAQEASDAAGDAVWDAVWDAAWDAAGAAAGDAAGDAVWDAVWGAAGAAARAAARAAAWAAAWAAAGDAARDVLKPVVVDLEASALDLFDAMLPLEPVTVPVLPDVAAGLCRVPA